MFQIYVILNGIKTTLFIYFLNSYGLLYRENKQTIDNNTLVALTLMIAESNPQEKEVIVDLIMNFLASATINKKELIST